MTEQNSFIRLSYQLRNNYSTFC